MIVLIFRNGVLNFLRSFLLTLTPAFVRATLNDASLRAAPGFVMKAEIVLEANLQKDRELISFVIVQAHAAAATLEPSDELCVCCTLFIQVGKRKHEQTPQRERLDLVRGKPCRGSSRLEHVNHKLYSFVLCSFAERGSARRKKQQLLENNLSFDRKNNAFRERK
jgi:hypothetical protein